METSTCMCEVSGGAGGSGVRKTRTHQGPVSLCFPMLRMGSPDLAAQFKELRKQSLWKK